jgi:uncharacterized protein YbjT (DUF2867 family)
MSLMEHPTIAVLGGTGFVGRSVCNRLEQRFGGGVRIRVPTRRLSHAAAVQSLPTVQVVQADVHDDAQLAAALGAADVVVNLVAILHGSRAAFEHVHVTLPRRLAAACRAARVRRLVHVSALGVPDDPGAAPSMYLRSKAAGEQVLLESGVPVTLLRPSVIFGAQDKFLNLFAQMQSVLPVLPLASAHAQFQPVWVEDVARAVVAAIERDAQAVQTFECAGPQVLSLKQIVQAAGRHAGCERPVFALPAPLARAQALAFEWLPGQPLMSRDNLDSMRAPNVATGRLPGLRELGIEPASLDSVAAGYLGGGSGPARFESWRAGRR